MNFGIPGRGHQGDWTLTLDEARPIVKAAFDNGLFYLIAPISMAWGPLKKSLSSLKEMMPRDEYVLATKISMPMGRGANKADSRANMYARALMPVCSVPVTTRPIIWQDTPSPPWDSRRGADPIEETLEALHDAVKEPVPWFVHVCLAIRRAAVDCQDEQLDPICPCKTTMFGLSGRRARNEPILRKHSGRADAVVTSGPWN